MDERRIPAAAAARLDALVSAKTRAPRSAAWPISARLWQRDRPSDSTALLRREYVRAMRFLYQKEFVAPRAAAPTAVEALYQSRGLSTDTAIEAGYVVQIGLATLKAVEPERRIRRVLIVGPGLDLAPRTGLIETGRPESYQPYTVIDALVSLGLSRVDDLVVVGGDVNPRVVSHLEGARTREVGLTLVTGLADGGALSLQDDYRHYVEGIGQIDWRDRTNAAVAADVRWPSEQIGSCPSRRLCRRQRCGARHRHHSDRGRRLRPDCRDQRVPYLDDTGLTLAVANIAGMLAPGGVLLHNEGRPLMPELAALAGLPVRHARTATIALVRGAPPLADAVWVHQKR